MKNEKLEKAIDSMIDELFADGTPLAKASDAVHAIVGESKKASGGEQKKPAIVADENGAKEEGEEDEKAGKKRGRPSDLSQMSMRDANGASKGSYDSSITEAAKKVPDETTVAKSFSISAEDYELLQKAKSAQQEETLQKARVEQKNLFKAAMEEAISPLKQENEKLRKSFEESQNLIKSLARKPQARKSISSVQVLEKSFGQGGSEEGAAKQETFTKSEMLDKAEELVKSKVLKAEHVIELEDTGFIYEPAARRALENALRSK